MVSPALGLIEPTRLSSIVNAQPLGVPAVHAHADTRARTRLVQPKVVFQASAKGAHERLTIAFDVLVVLRALCAESAIGSGRRAAEIDQQALMVHFAPRQIRDDLEAIATVDDEL